MNRIEHTNDFYENKEFWKSIVDKNFQRSTFSDKALDIRDNLYCSTTFRVAEDVSKRILSICNNSNIGIYIYLISAVLYILKFYTGNDDVFLGIERLSKSKSDISDLDVAIFKDVIDDDSTFKEFLMKSKGMFVNVNKFNKLNIREMQQLVGVEDFDNEAAIIDTMVRMKNLNLGHEFKNISLSTMFEFEVKDSTIFCTIVYNINSVSQARIGNLKRHLMSFLTQVSHNSNIKLKNINVLEKEEVNRLIELGKGKKNLFNKEDSIDNLFEKQVEKTPNKIAIVCEDRKLTYRELNEKANCVARLLREKGVKEESVVGVMVEKSMEMVVGIIAILKAGGVYLPIDPTCPKNRIEYMLNDSESKILLSSKRLIDKIDFYGEFIDLFDRNIMSSHSGNLDIVNEINRLAYIIYTSGTTGNPKGVMCEHINVIRLVKEVNYIQFVESDKILQTGSLVFDASTFEIWGALLNGLELHLCNKENSTLPEFLEKVITTNNITILWLTSELFNQIAEENVKLFKNLRYLLVGGDVISPKHIRLVRKECKNLNIINGYGPTENTTFSTTYLIEKEYTSSIPIGKPISNSNVYIIDKNYKLMPIGVTGELCVSGDGLARGYLHRSELTAEKFVDNPFELGSKLYRTGDLARWLPDGNIEFLGRIDNQVKIRGFRIELGEIENKLLNHKDINSVAVVVKNLKENDKYICAYIVSNKDVSELNLYDYLKEVLPEYMIPAYFVNVEKMPITSNGKLDRRSLPNPNFEKRSTDYQSPRNDVEELLANIWEEVLGVNNIGVKDNFFELGGNSLKAMQLVSKIQKEFKINILITDILNLITIEKIATCISDNKFFKVSYEQLKVVEKRSYYPVTPSQKRMFILQSLKPLDTAYNVQTIKKIKGNLDIGKLEDCFIKLIYRHEGLRTHFELEANEVVQVVDPSFDFEIEVIEKENNDLDGLILESIKPFDLGKSPLIKVVIIKNCNNEYVVVIDTHHICTDAITFKILISELEQLYNGISLEQMKFQYKDFSCWQVDLLKSYIINNQRRYWLNKFSDYDYTKDIFQKYRLNYSQEGIGKRIKFNIGNMLKSQLENLCRDKEVTLYIVLLTAYFILLYRFSNEEDIVIGTPIGGRHYPNLEKIVGVFINTLAIRATFNEDESVAQLVKQIKKTMYEAFLNQDYPFDYVINDLNIERKEKNNPLFNIMFTLNNVNYKNLNLSDLCVEEYDVNYTNLMVDLSLDGEILDEELTFVLEYNNMIFNKAIIDKFIYNYVKILRNIINWNIKIGDIQLDEFNVNIR